jgi:shikimate kinase
VNFTDLDELVEQQTGKTPRALYKECPERFRRAEAQALEYLLADIQERIVAAGGGIVDNETALNLLKKAETIRIVYLEVSPETAWNRILAAGPLPPFLDTPNPRETHERLHQRRGAAYKALAHITIPAEAGDPAALAQHIAAALRRP